MSKAQNQVCPAALHLLQPWLALFLCGDSDCLWDIDVLCVFLMFEREKHFFALKIVMKNANFTLRESQIWPSLFNWFFSSARVGYWDAKTMSLFSLKVRDSQRWNIALLWSVLPALNTKRENSCQNIDPDYRTHEWTQPYKRDLYKREGKGRRCCLGYNILLAIGWTNPFLYVIQVQLILFFISTWCKTASVARSWINCDPQTAATTFAISSA